MIKEILNGILNMLSYIVNLVLTPINLLIENIFPDLNDLILAFEDICWDVRNVAKYFFSLIPTMTRNLIFIWITFIIAYYGVIYTYLGIKKIWEVIQKLKFW